jgi:hypothetical protein
MEYTDYQKYQNYQRILQHIQMLKTMPLTEDRLEEYKKYFRVMRCMFPDCRMIDEHNTDPKFRSIANSLEANMEYLEFEFDASIYLQALTQICEMVNYKNEDDVLVNMMRSMGF